MFWIAGGVRCAVVLMLFHNRPVRAAMGSVIVNSGVMVSLGGFDVAQTCNFTFLEGWAE